MRSGLDPRTALPPGPGSFGNSGPGSGAPEAARIRLGARLRRLREAAGVSRPDAAAAIRASASKLSRLELGRTGIKPRDLSDLLTLYRVPEHERDSMTALARTGRDPGWWHGYGDAVAGWRKTYVGLEQSASLIRGYEPRFIPELLQTPQYARILRHSMREDGDGDRAERQAAVLARRQGILHREDPPHVWLVIDEAALRRPVGAPAVMRAQLGHLIDTARLGRVNIQVLPFRAGGHAACGGPVALLRFSGEQVPDVVCLEYSGSAVFPSGPAVLDCYWGILNQLATQADPPIASALVLEQIRRELLARSRLG